MLCVAKEHIFPDIKIVYKAHKYAKVQNSIMCVFLFTKKTRVVCTLKKKRGIWYKYAKGVIT